MTLLIDRLINICKWPIALVAIFALPSIFQVNAHAFSQSFSNGGWLFWVGTIGYIILWRWFFSGRMWGSSIPTLIHECIHALFALLTLHRVVDLKVRWNSGGHVRYIGGEGNWLITISPYFFPLSLVIAFVISPFLQIDDGLRLLLLGLLFGFEVVCTWREMHPGQTDLQKVGFVFAFAFLPSALLFSYGAVLSYALGEFSLLEQYLGECWDLNWARLSLLMSSIPTDSITF